MTGGSGEVPGEYLYRCEHGVAPFPCTTCHKPRVRDRVAAAPAPKERDELREALSWALDMLDMADERLVKLGQPPELVHSEVHRAAKAKARAALAGKPSGAA